jgi:uncharacterized protein
MMKNGAGYAMSVEKNVGIAMRDGLTLHANVFRPDAPGRFPVILSLGIYGKDVHFADAYKPQWEALKKLYPEIDANGSSGRYLRWELPDPERWVPGGYVMIAIDARGSGQSPGYLDPFSPTEVHDYYDAIEWAGEQPWSNGKVGLLGISYLSITQWRVAGLQPPHLAAICPWEGGSDLYRDWSHHGGILSDLFPTAWMPRQVLPNQHGNAKTHHRDRETGQSTTGSLDLGEEVLRGNRADHAAELLAHPLDDEWYKQRSPKFDRIKAPLLSAGNWGGHALHLRGNIEGYVRSASSEKWLFVHIGTHFESFYLPDYIQVQKRFFDHYLKDEDNGWTKESPVQLEIRRVDSATLRAEAEWPLARTQWTKYFLDAQTLTLATVSPAGEAKASYHSLGEGLTFTTAPFEKEVEFTGPIAARLVVSSSTTDMDIFATLRLFDPDGKEVVFVGASEPVPVTRGWLRVSQRKLDPALTTPYRPYHAHDEKQPIAPDDIHEVDLEIWPTSIVVPPGYRVALTLQGKDFEFPGVPGRMLHHSSADRPGSIYDTTNAVLSGPEHASYLLLPLIPSESGR